MEELDTYRQELLSALEGVVNKLSKTVASIPFSAWHLPLWSGSHTPHYTLAYLRELESQVFAIQLPHILAEDMALLPVFDGDVWMASHYKPEEPAQIIMEDFANLRKKELIWLRDVSPEGWSRFARHPWWGVHTLQWWVELQLDYSNQHLRELSRIIHI